VPAGAMSLDKRGGVASPELAKELVTTNTQNPLISQSFLTICPT
jgi:hypothetical protein